MHIAMHEVLLGGWGCPIGELFDLEALSEMCKQQQRWSFFVTSEVCNVPGGVARSVLFCIPCNGTGITDDFTQSTECYSNLLMVYMVWKTFTHVWRR